MKKKISVILLSTILTGTVLIGTLSTFAENIKTEQYENISPKISKDKIKFGKITAISNNTISLTLFEKSEKQTANKKLSKSLSDDISEDSNKKEPLIPLSNETITIDVTDSVKIKTESSDSSDISSLSVDDVITLVYNDDNELIEISNIHGRIFKNKNIKLAKITSISDNTLSVSIAEKPEKNTDSKPSDSISYEDNYKKEPPLPFSEETITIDVTDSVKIKTESSDSSDISSLSVDDVITLVYNDDNELIEISNIHGRIFKNKNIKLAKITSISDNTLSVSIAEKPERTTDSKPSDSISYEDNYKKESPLPFSEETITIDVTDSVKIKTESSDSSDISSLSVDDVITLVYNDNNELIEILSSGFRNHKKTRTF